MDLLLNVGSLENLSRYRDIFTFISQLCLFKVNGCATVELKQRCLVWSKMSLAGSLLWITWNWSCIREIKQINDIRIIKSVSTESCVHSE